MTQAVFRRRREYALERWALRLIGLGLLALATFLLLGHADLQGAYASPGVLGLVHALVLLWLLPVALVGVLRATSPGGRPHARWLAALGLGLYAVGAPGLFAHLLTFNTSVGMLATAGLVWFGLALFTVHVVIAVRSSGRLDDLAARFMLAALFWLLLAGLIGLLLVLSLRGIELPGQRAGWIRAHAWLAAFGFFANLVLAAGYAVNRQRLEVSGAAPGHDHLVWLGWQLGLLMAGEGLANRPGWFYAGLLLAAVALVGFALRVMPGLRRELRWSMGWKPWRIWLPVAWAVLAVACGVWAWIGRDYGPANVAFGVALLFGMIGSSSLACLSLLKPIPLLPVVVWHLAGLLLVVATLFLQPHLGQVGAWLVAVVALWLQPALWRSHSLYRS